jgi:hypothetical protein
MQKKYIIIIFAKTILFSFFHLYAMERASVQNVRKKSDQATINLHLSQNTIRHIQSFANQDLLPSLKFGPGIDGIQQLSLRIIEQPATIIQNTSQYQYPQNIPLHIIHDKNVRENITFASRKDISEHELLNTHQTIINKIYNNPQLKEWYEKQLHILIPTIAETFRCPTPFNTIVLDLVEFNPERAIDDVVKNYLEYAKQEFVTNKILETSWKIKNGKLEFQICGSSDKRLQCAWSIANYLKHILPPQKYKDTIQSFAREYGIGEFAEIVDYNYSAIIAWGNCKKFAGENYK